MKVLLERETHRTLSIQKGPPNGIVYGKHPSEGIISRKNYLHSEDRKFRKDLHMTIYVVGKTSSRSSIPIRPPDDLLRSENLQFVFYDETSFRWGSMQKKPDLKQSSSRRRLHMVLSMEKTFRRYSQSKTPPKNNLCKNDLYPEDRQDLHMAIQVGKNSRRTSKNPKNGILHIKDFQFVFYDEKTSRWRYIRKNLT